MVQNGEIFRVDNDVSQVNNCSQHSKSIKKTINDNRFHFIQ